MMLLYTVYNIYFVCCCICIYHSPVFPVYPKLDRNLIKYPLFFSSRKFNRLHPRMNAFTYLIALVLAVYEVVGGEKSLDHCTPETAVNCR